MHDVHSGMRAAPAISSALEQALRASDEILERLPVATYICDPEGRIVQYNRRAVELWGRPPRPGETHEQFTRQSRFYDAAGAELRESKLNEVLKTGHPVRDQEVTVIRPDGARAFVVNIEPLQDAAGRLIGAVSCLQDVTERKRAIEALDRSRQDLHQQEQRWNATYEHAAIGIVETDAQGRFLRVNESICGITGLSRDELLG